jgi:hypothetical protein
MRLATSQRWECSLCGSLAAVSLASAGRCWTQTTARKRSRLAEGVHVWQQKERAASVPPPTRACPSASFRACPSRSSVSSRAGNARQACGGGPSRRARSVFTVRLRDSDAFCAFSRLCSVSSRSDSVFSCLLVETSVLSWANEPPLARSADRPAIASAAGDRVGRETARTCVSRESADTCQASVLRARVWGVVVPCGRSVWSFTGCFSPSTVLLRAPTASSLAARPSSPQLR